MDPTNPNDQPPAPGQPETTVQKAEDEIKLLEQQVEKRFRDHKLFFPIIIVVIIILIWALIALLFPKNNSNRAQNATPTPTSAVKRAKQPKPSSKQQSQTLVYGTWTSQSSVVRAVNLATQKITTVATLPLTIKKITVLSNNTLLYIDQTDSNDHGQRISIYNIPQKQITTNIPAASGYSIDDYVLSPNKRYLALWEVQFSSETPTLQGGLSRVYMVDLTQPSIPTLLYDETATLTIPIHYPRAVLNDGTVLTDQFIPNDPNGGTGWAYGMSTIDADGTNQQSVPSMTNGTYGSQPSLSPDGKFLLFAGYDGGNGNGTAVNNGYRQALLTPDTVELMDTKTFKRFKLSNLPPSNIYSDVQWDKQTGNVIISILSQDTKQIGVYSYDLGTLHAMQIPLPLVNGTQYGFITQLSDTKTLIGIQSTDAANLGNLGETYAYAYTQLAITDQQGKLAYISVEDPFVQYISVLPSDYFGNVLGASTAQISPQPNVTYAVLQGTDSNPQNYTFFLKTRLASLRVQGKSNPVNQQNSLMCQDLGTARCSALGIVANSTAFLVCQNNEKANNRTANACY